MLTAPDLTHMKPANINIKVQLPAVQLSLPVAYILPPMKYISHLYININIYNSQDTILYQEQNYSDLSSKAVHILKRKLLRQPRLLYTTADTSLYTSYTCFAYSVSALWSENSASIHTLTALTISPLYHCQARP